MRKRVTACLVILLLFVPLFAVPDLYFRLNDRCTLIDLESRSFLPHLMTSRYDDTISMTDSEGKTNDGYYYYEQSLASMGIVDINFLNSAAAASTDGKATLVMTVSTAEKTADSWYYTLVEDRRYKRHVGVDIFSRGAPSAGGSHVNIDIDGNGNTGIHIGNNAPIDTISFDIIQNGRNLYKSAWADICLVLEDETSDDQLIAADSYYIINLEFDIKVVDGDGQIMSYGGNPLSDKFLVQIMGYYRPEDEAFSKDNTAIFYVERFENDINISSAYSSGEWIDVSSYFFTTDSKVASLYNTSDPGSVYIFLSSTSDGSRNDADVFTLKRKRGPSIQSQSEYESEINYVARFKADGTGMGHAYNSSALTTSEADGTAYFPDDYQTTSLVIGAESFKDNRATFLRWYDQGTIQLKIPSGEGQRAEIHAVGDSVNLKSGSYESTIYIHIVTDFHPK